METIRIIKRRRNRGAGYFFGFLLTVIIIGAIIWFLTDQNFSHRNGALFSRDTIENQDYNRYDTTVNDNEPYQNPYDANIKRYVSFVNREVIPSDSIENQTKQTGASLLQVAITDVQGQKTNYRNNRFQRDSEAVSDSAMHGGNALSQRRDSDSAGPSGNQLSQRKDVDTAGWSHNVPNNQLADQFLLKMGNQLVDLQQKQYPGLSKMGESLKKSMDSIKQGKYQHSEDIRGFFIASSGLLQEMASK